MKPIVIYLDRRDGKIELTRKEFEDYINEAYQQGYDCGYAEGKKYYPWWGTGGITCTPTNAPREITYGTSTPNPKPNITITCDNDRNSIFASGNKVTATNSIYPGDNAIEKVITDSTMPKGEEKCAN